MTNIYEVSLYRGFSAFHDDIKWVEATTTYEAIDKAVGLQKDDKSGVLKDYTYAIVSLVVKDEYGVLVVSKDHKDTVLLADREDYRFHVPRVLPKDNPFMCEECGGSMLQRFNINGERISDKCPDCMNRENED